MNKRIMIVAGEASADLHGANLVRALQKRNNLLQFYGMGGPNLVSAGVEIIYDAALVSVVGIFEIFSHLGDILLAQRTLRKKLETAPPALLILIDLPDFNLPLAKKAKRLGIPVFYYISPQVWAWRSKRVKKLESWVDKMGVILPFEKDFFAQRGVSVEYVGHPLVDTVNISMTHEEFCTLHGISCESQCIGLFPGSRKSEVFTLLPVFVQTAQELQDKSSRKIIFFIPRASTISTYDLENAGNLSAYRHYLDIRIIEEDRYNMMAACDVVVTASGTISLELAILGVPMVVVYKLSSLTYYMAKRLVKQDFFSLVNLIAGYEVVPELLQHDVTAENILKSMTALLTDPKRMDKMKNALRKVKEELGTRGASEKAAIVALQTMTGSHS